MFLPFHDDNPTSRTPWATLSIIAVNVVVFLWTLQLPPQEQQELFFTRGFVPARIANLDHPRPIPIAAQPGMALAPMEPRQVYLSMITCLFLHAGWLHLIGNMWFLWIFGNNVEDRLGPVPYVFLYLGGGILASLCHWWIVRGNPGSTMPVVGASGAVATILGAYAITWPWARVHTLIFLVIFITVVDLPALLVLGFWFLGQVLSVASPKLGVDGNVAFWAHIGGFVAGMALMPILSGLFGAGPPDAREFVDVEIVDDSR